jgi:hypothetical protein
MIKQRNFPRLAGLVATGALAALLSGCVVAPVGYSGYDGYPTGAVYVAPPPVVVAPGYYGYRGYGGYGPYRGYRGHGGHWR